MKAPNGIWLLLRGVHFDMDKPMVLLSPLRLIRACIKQRDRARKVEARLEDLLSSLGDIRDDS